MQRPLISIIITILNGEETLPACLESIACQSFTSYELVIIDGGSTDGTLEIINSCSIRQLNLKVRPGIGLYAGLNAGIDIATGDWYYFMGCDDRLFACDVLDQIATHLKAVTSTNRMVAGRVYYPKRRIITNPQTWGLIALTYKLHHQGLFYNRSLFNVLRYDTSLRFSADYEINVKHIVGGTKIDFVSTIVAEFGEDGESSQNLRKAYLERQCVHNGLFSGLALSWIKVIASLQYNTWVMRKSLKYGD